MEVFRTWPSSQWDIKDVYTKKHAYWGVTRACRGIAPRMIAELPPSVAKEVFGLDMSPYDKDREGAFEAEMLLWRPILLAKFTQNPPMLQILRSTAPALLVDYARFRKTTQYWSGFLDAKEGRIIGKNMMGRILTALRDELE